LWLLGSVLTVGVTSLLIEAAACLLTGGLVGRCGLMTIMRLI
jgi:hypothetical protein